MPSLDRRIVQHATSRRVEIVELPALHAPEERGHGAAREQQRQWDQEQHHGHVAS
jgi:hypothetical protein